MNSSSYRGINGIISPFRHIVARYKSALGLAVFSMILVDVFAYALPGLIKYVTDTVYPEIQNQGALESLFVFGGLILAVAVLRGFTAHVMIRSYWYVGETVVHDIRNELFEKLQHLQAPFYDTARTGDLMSRVSNDVQMIRNFFAYGIEHRLRIVLISSTVLVLMLVQNWRLALMVYLFIPLVFFMVIYFSKKMGAAVGRKHHRTGTLSSFVQENLRGIRIIKAFAAESRQIVQFDGENSQLRDAGMEVSDLQAKMNPLLILTNTIGSLVILFYGGYQIIQGQGNMTLGTLLGFITYLSIMGFPVFILAFNTSLMSLASGASRRIHEILAKPDQRKANTGHHRSEIQGRLEFQNVSFSYPESETILDGLNFCIKPGERVAVFGLTGSGKSSLISLIPRFYEPMEGSILLDGTPLPEWELEFLRSRIGMVLQESFIFSTSIQENIAYGKPEASIQEIQDAARAARIHDFIESLPEGYNSQIGEFGVGLSGGQRQRIAIARALLKDPQLLILDDCTSSLDSKTEREIQQELQQLMKGRTTLIIAQRISTLRLADRIILLHDGKLHHMEPHDRLLEKSPLYRSVYESQMMYGSIGEDSLTGRS
ncbi:ABC transporter ATP-binding protein [Salinispira pacifica]|uniref:Lipid A export ATP-binding/permease protein MsbA n=1 Tax=Salinispira pacifica TaxID=1307761 RepID=V5WNC8_9SPIO|nr:ABC transporter ATP-binding protein [Salinispira pacifica]AHC16744.1 Lipid A export ATP-binding/permease protein MsbA [Salinispira pacifica]